MNGYLKNFRPQIEPEEEYIDISLKAQSIIQKSIVSLLQG